MREAKQTGGDDREDEGEDVDMDVDEDGFCL